MYQSGIQKIFSYLVDVEAIAVKAEASLISDLRDFWQVLILEFV